MRNSCADTLGNASINVREENWAANRTPDDEVPKNGLERLFVIVKALVKACFNAVRIDQTQIVLLSYNFIATEESTEIQKVGIPQSIQMPRTARGRTISSTKSINDVVCNSVVIRLNTRKKIRIERLVRPY